MEEDGGYFFARHKSLSEEERQKREDRTQFFQRAAKNLKKFNPLSDDFTQQTLYFLQQQFANIRWMLRETEIPLTDDVDDGILDANVSTGALRALRLANVYLWAVVPLKVQFLRLDEFKPVQPTREELYQEVWHEEHQLLQELRFWAKDFRKSRGENRRFAPHSLCQSGWWKASALADCSEHLLTALRTWDDVLPANSGDQVPDLVPPAVCTFSAIPDEVAVQHLMWSHCVADAMQYHVSCAYTQLFTKRDLDEAAAHLQVASLVAMLCDGCRVDGQGFSSVPLDEVLWRFGLLVLEALQLKDLDWEEDPQRYAWAAGTVSSSPPRSAWRGSEPLQAILFGRPKCQAVLRPPLCIQENIIATGDFVAEDELVMERLPTCHYERQKASSTGLQLRPMNLKDAQDALASTGPASCSVAPLNTILLLLPVYPKMMGHLTSEMIWLTGALGWFYGPTGKKLLRALWQAAGEHPHMGLPPEGLLRNTTEVLLVPSPGRYADPEQLLLKDLFSLLSSRPIRSLLPNKDGCRCYRRGAVWGYLEAPFSGTGDFTFPDSVAMRAALVRHLKLVPSLPGPNAIGVLLVDRCKDTAGCKRSISNLNHVMSAISELEDVKLQRVRLQELPLLEQVRLILETQVLLAAFGATLAWLPLLRSNSFVIEMHPGPPEALTLWGSCWTAPPAVYPKAAAASWDLNPRSEFGGWARTAHVNYACSSKPTSINRRCLRSLRVASFEVWSFEVNVEEIVALVNDAIERLKRR